MPNPSKPHQPADRSSFGSLAWAAGAGLLMVVCCALPALIAGGVAAGVLGALGVRLSNPWVIGLAVVLLVIVAGGIARRLSRHAYESDGVGQHDCYAPTSEPAHPPTGRSEH